MGTRIPLSTANFANTAAVVGVVSTPSFWVYVKSPAVAGISYELAIPAELFDYSNGKYIAYNPNTGTYPSNLPTGTVFTILEGISSPQQEVISTLTPVSSSATWYTPTTWYLATGSSFAADTSVSLSKAQTQSFQNGTYGNWIGPYLAYLAFNSLDIPCFPSYQNNLNYAIVQCSYTYICPPDTTSNVYTLNQAQISFSFQSNPYTLSQYLVVPTASEYFFQFYNVINFKVTSIFMVPYSTGTGTSVGVADFLFYSPYSTDYMQQKVVHTGQTGYVGYIYVYYNTDPGNPKITSSGFSSIVLPKSSVPFMIDPNITYYNNPNGGVTFNSSFFNRIWSTSGETSPTSSGISQTVAFNGFTYTYCGYLGINFGLGNLNGIQNQNSAMQTPDLRWNVGQVFIGSYPANTTTQIPFLSGALGNTNIQPNFVSLSSSTLTPTNVQNYPPFCS